MKELTFNALREASVLRCNTHFHPLDGWSGAEYGNAAAGEFGEVAVELLELQSFLLTFFTKLKTCDTIKKLLRQAEQDEAYQDLIEKLRLELADIILYIDLLAARFNINLNDAVIEKFNIVSDRVESEIKL